MVDIHPTAVIEDDIFLGENIKIGPFVHIRSHVKIGDNTVIDAGAVIDSFTTMGNDNKVFPNAVVGTVPQDLKFKGEFSELRIGDNNTIRECAMINRGTKGGGGVTKIGNNNLIMAYVHIAHDCQIGNDTIIANSVQFAGHVIVENNAVIGGMSAIHQFARIGKYAMVAAMSGISKDVAPFCLAVGNRAKLNGLNTVGLSRAGFSYEAINNLKQAYRLIFRSNLTFKEAYDQLKNSSSKEVIHLIDFLNKSTRGFCRDK